MTTTAMAPAAMTAPLIASTTMTSAAVAMATTVVTTPAMATAIPTRHCHWRQGNGCDQHNVDTVLQNFFFAVVHSNTDLVIITDQVAPDPGFVVNTPISEKVPVYLLMVNPYDLVIVLMSEELSENVISASDISTGSTPLQPNMQPSSLFIFTVDCWRLTSTFMIVGFREIWES